MSGRGAEPGLPTAPGREMLIELLGLHALALRRMPWVQSSLVVGLGLLIIPHVNRVLFLAWGAATIGIEAGRARYAASVLRRSPHIDPALVHGRFVALAALAGSGIGAGAVMFLPGLPVMDQAVFAVVLVAIPAAGVAVSQSSRYILAGYAACILLPAAITWSLLFPGQAWGVSVLICLVLVVLTLVASDGEQLLLRSVAIRHERDRLVRDLEQRNADVRAAMADVQAAMAQAEQSAQARARILAAASHDLRQPLHALSVYSAVLASKPAPDLLHEVSGNIDQIVRALGNLLNGLLDLSRLSAGYYVPEQRELSLQTLVAGVCGEYQQAAAQKGLAFISELAPLHVRGDPVAIGRIARNLIDNAIKYTEHGEIRVRTHHEVTDGMARAVLSVFDTGRGIPAAEHGRIFEEFYQLDNPGRDRSKGVGLGLAIVQRLCELTGARISVDSVVGEGTCFRVSMPALLKSAARLDPMPAAAAEASLHGKTVYVVDDETDIRKSMCALLGVWGVRSAAADSASAADSLFEARGAPDLLIVDLRVGDGEHGAQLADRLRHRFGGFPVLIITGETSSEALRQANESAYTVLQKPIAPEVLRSAMAAAVAGAADVVH
jgi:signal transduction histidine kinase/CheY-like chemotaxis protein